MKSVQKDEVLLFGKFVFLIRRRQLQATPTTILQTLLTVSTAPFIRDAIGNYWQAFRLESCRLHGGLSHTKE